MNPNRFLNYSEVAQTLGGISERSVRRLVASGLLPQPVKVLSIPMIPSSELEEFMQKTKDSRNK